MNHDSPLPDIAFVVLSLAFLLGFFGCASYREQHAQMEANVAHCQTDPDWCNAYEAEQLDEARASSRHFRGETFPSSWTRVGPNVIVVP